MKPGSHFVLDDSECIPATGYLNGIIFATDQADIHIYNGELVSHLESPGAPVVSAFVETVFVADFSDSDFNFGYYNYRKKNTYI